MDSSVSCVRVRAGYNLYDVCDVCKRTQSKKFPTLVAPWRLSEGADRHGRNEVVGG